MSQIHPCCSFNDCCRVQTKIISLKKIKLISTNVGNLSTMVSAHTIIIYLNLCKYKDLITLSIQAIILRKTETEYFNDFASVCITSAFSWMESYLFNCLSQTLYIFQLLKTFVQVKQQGPVLQKNRRDLGSICAVVMEAQVARMCRILTSVVLLGL